MYDTAKPRERDSQSKNACTLSKVSFFPPVLGAWFSSDSAFRVFDANLSCCLSSMSGNCVQNNLIVTDSLVHIYVLFKLHLMGETPIPRGCIKYDGDGD